MTDISFQNMTSLRIKKINNIKWYPGGWSVWELTARALPSLTVLVSELGGTQLCHSPLWGDQKVLPAHISKYFCKREEWKIFNSAQLILIHPSKDSGMARGAGEVSFLWVMFCLIILSLSGLVFRFSFGFGLGLLLDNNAKQTVPYCLLCRHLTVPGIVPELKNVCSRTQTICFTTRLVFEDRGGRTCISYHESSSSRSRLRKMVGGALEHLMVWLCCAGLRNLIPWTTPAAPQ